MKKVIRNSVIFGALSVVLGIALEVLVCLSIYSNNYNQIGGDYFKGPSIVLVILHILIPVLIPFIFLLVTKICKRINGYDKEDENIVHSSKTTNLYRIIKQFVIFPIDCVVFVGFVLGYFLLKEYYSNNFYNSFRDGGFVTILVILSIVLFVIAQVLRFLFKNKKSNIVSSVYYISKALLYVVCLANILRVDAKEAVWIEIATPSAICSLVCLILEAITLLLSLACWALDLKILKEKFPGEY